MANRTGREALRGAEIETLDLISQGLKSAEWAELLKDPLERAAGQGNRGLAQKLADAGADIGDALHAAVRGGHRDVMTDLLNRKISINVRHSVDGGTPLHVAALQGDQEMVQLLMLEGAASNAMDDYGRTPLYIAASFDHAIVAGTLLAKGADVSIRCHALNLSVLHPAAREGHVDILRVAIEHGADLDMADVQQSTALHCAAIFNKPEAIEVLVDAGANVEARTDIGATPLHIAAATLNLGPVTALVKHGACVNAKNIALITPLHHAATKAGAQGASEVVDVLLRSGADETIVDRNGQVAAGVVGKLIDDQDRLVDDVERVRKLLKNAQVDRTWRRRGYLVLCRAHPDRVGQTHDSGAHASKGRRTRHGSKLRRQEARGRDESVGGTAADGVVGPDWASVVTKVLGLQEDDVFRAIVGYL